MCPASFFALARSFDSVGKACCFVCWVVGLFWGVELMGNSVIESGGLVGFALSAGTELAPTDNKSGVACSPSAVC